MTIIQYNFYRSSSNDNMPERPGCSYLFAPLSDALRWSFNAITYASPRTLNAAHAFSCSDNSLSSVASASISASIFGNGVGGISDFAGESALITLPWIWEMRYWGSRMPT
jgi:hypothetical protein